MPGSFLHKAFRRSRETNLAHHSADRSGKTRLSSLAITKGTGRKPDSVLSPSFLTRMHGEDYYPAVSVRDILPALPANPPERLSRRLIWTQEFCLSPTVCGLSPTARSGAGESHFPITVQTSPSNRISARRGWINCFPRRTVFRPYIRS